MKQRIEELLVYILNNEHHQYRKEKSKPPSFFKFGASYGFRRVLGKVSKNFSAKALKHYLKRVLFLDLSCPFC